MTTRNEQNFSAGHEKRKIPEGTDIQVLKVPVKVFLHEAQCPLCNAGQLVSQGPVSIFGYISPEQYTHSCNNCGATTVLTKEYPLPVYERIVE